ncbi:MAG TPA: DUF6058 family natural product biosynthesis protein [Solirubrobacteraceae bacterium]|nr:DUF6058 family natural product biosynthesis protein [Solirubrobacteraceae bacterium]
MSDGARLRTGADIAAELARADAEYRRAGFVTIEELCAGRPQTPDEVRALIGAGRLPQPAYVDEDGAELVPPDHLALADEAGGVQRLEERFRERYEAAARALGDERALAQLDAEWEAYRGGAYGMCLREVTPEHIVEKDHLMRRVEALLERPAREDAAWLGALRDAVDRLDALERPFAPLDEHRLGARPSRRRLIDDVRARYPELLVPPA